MLRSMIRFLWQRLCNRSRTKVQQKITVVVSDKYHPTTVKTKPSLIVPCQNGYVKRFLLIARNCIFKNHDFVRLAPKSPRQVGKGGHHLRASGFPDGLGLFGPITHRFSTPEGFPGSATHLTQTRGPPVIGIAMPSNLP